MLCHIDCSIFKFLKLNIGITYIFASPFDKQNPFEKTLHINSTLSLCLSLQLVLLLEFLYKNNLSYVLLTYLSPELRKQNISLPKFHNIIMIVIYFSPLLFIALFVLLHISAKENFISC